MHRSPINLTEAVLTSIYTIASRAAFGKNCKDQEKFISVVKKTSKLAAGFGIEDLFPSVTWLQHVTGLRAKLERLHQQADQIMENIINEHKEANSKAKDDQSEAEEDLVDVLIQYEDGSKKDFSLTRNNIKAIILDIFAAGGETTATTIDWAMAEMVKNPTVMKKAQSEVREVCNMKARVDENCINELQYLKLIVKETLRLHPPAPLLLPRECGQTCEIHGYHIPAKTKVIVNAWAIGRDPNYWTESERFYPERFIDSTIDYKGSNFEFIPFGAGRRICAGSTFALRAAELALAMLLYHFDWKLPSGMRSGELDMSEDFGVTTIRKDNLFLAFCFHHESSNHLLHIHFSIFIFMFMAHKIMKKKSASTPNLPPGPWKLPIIGNILNIVGSLPHCRLRDLSAKYGPLMHLKLGEVSTIVVSSPEYAKEVLNTHDLIFSSRPPILASKIMSYDSKGMSFAPYGDYWRWLRKICTSELLSSKCVQSFQPIRGEELTNFIKRIASKEGSAINLTKEVLTTVSTIVSRTALGNKCRDHQKFISSVREGTEAAGGFDLGDLYPSAEWLQHISGLKPKLEKYHQQADRIMQSIINEHREAKSSATQGQGEEVADDLVDVLMKEEFGLSDNSIKAVILDMFGGGTQTSSTTITWAMAEMIKNPRVTKKIHAETLRLYPPGPLLLPRQCGQDCEINGYHIPIKSKVIVNAWAIGRDPNHWSEAERFYPERFIGSSVDYKGNSFEYIPFGAGRRICPGLTFGLTNVELPLAFLMYHFDWKLPNGMKNEDLDMTEALGVSARRKDDLCLIPITFHP
ncbi:Cytochrome P450 71D9 [Glycine soja]